MTDFTKEDLSFMRRAISLSRKGFPAPNPHVGCVLARHGEIVGEGFHDHAGGPHAEAAALERAGSSAEGSTAYVTLEPCNHFGRTPPCSLALINAGIRRVVVAVGDPNPKASGGADAMRNAGIEVSIGCLKLEATAANWQFLASYDLGRPVFVVKAAMSLDARIALPDGRSQWITGELARREGHRLRAEMGAVLVGRRTVEADNPLLTARIPGVVNQPLRIVLDPSEKLTGRERVFDNSAPTLRVQGRSSGAGIDLKELAQDLFQRGITGVLVEGGAVTIRSFLEAGLVDRLELFIAPKILGAGPTWIAGPEVKDLDVSRFGKIVNVRRLGEDVQLSIQEV